MKKKIAKKKIAKKTTAKKTTIKKTTAVTNEDIYELLEQIVYNLLPNIENKLILMD